MDFDEHTPLFVISVAAELATCIRKHSGSMTEWDWSSLSEPAENPVATPCEM
jgi:hypothetical protein